MTFKPGNPGQQPGRDHFKPNQQEVHEDAKADGPRVVKIDTASVPVVQEFELSRLSKEGEGDYAFTRKKYGALAATDFDRSTVASKTRKDARFSINSLLRDPLSIEEEERRVMDEKVQARVSAIEEEARARASEIGYADGLKQGHEEAFRRFQTESAERMAGLEQLIASLEGAKREIFRANERYLVELVFRVARMVLLRELSADKEYVLRLTRELIERVGARENIRVRVHPDDLETAALLKDGLEKALGTLQNLNVEASAQVRRGGCELETQWNVIDASVETQLEGIHDALVGSKA